MGTRVIAIINQKGGPGKTTVATNLASYIHKQGHSVMLVDLDPQGSATHWSEMREEADAFPVIRMGKTLARDLPKIATGKDWVIIDGAPQVADLTAAAIKAADTVIIPVQPSPYDVWACADLVDLVHARREVTDGLPRSAFVISRAIQNTRLSGEVDEVLAGYELPILKRRTTQRVDYAEVIKDGGSVLDLHPDNKAHHEAKMLAREIMEFAHG